MSQHNKVWQHLLKYGSITSLEMFNRYYICCPHAIIRDLRKLHPEVIKDLWVEKTRIEKDEGANDILGNSDPQTCKTSEKRKDKKVSIRYKMYYINGEQESNDRVYLTN